MAGGSLDARIAPARERMLWRSGGLALLFGGLLAAATFVAYSGRGLFGDEGSFCTVAQGVLDGRLPYRDFFNEKPPLQYFWTAAVMAFGGSTLAGARIASSIVLALTAACIVAGPLQRRASGLAVAGIMLATAMVAIRMEAFRNTADSTLALLYVLSAVFITRGPVSTRSALALGVLHGVALGFRQTVLASMLVMLFSPNLGRRRMLFVGGVIAGLLAWLLPLAATGVFPDFVKATLLFHVGNADAGEYIAHNIHRTVSILVWFLLLAAIATGPARRGGSRYWALAWLAALSFAYFGRQEEFRLWPSAAAALAILAWEERPADAPAPSFVRLVREAGLLGAAVVLAGVTAIYGRPPLNPAIESLAVALTRVSQPRKEVWAGPFSPYVYCLSQRHPASRYYFVLPWTAKAEVRAEIARNISAKRPVVVIERSIPGFGLDDLAPEVASILKQRYRPVTGEPGVDPARFTVYRPTEP